MKGFFCYNGVYKTLVINMSSSTLQRTYCISNFKMHCFVCDKVINRGDEITQTLESGGMELRRVPYTGSRWVHCLCVPKNETTLYFMNVVDEMQADYPECTIEEIMDSVENHDYWTFEEDNLPVWSISPIRPPNPPPVSNDQVDPVEKTVDETPLVLEEDPDKGINELCIQVEDTLELVKKYASNEQKMKIARVLFG